MKVAFTAAKATQMLSDLLELPGLRVLATRGLAVQTDRPAEAPPGHGRRHL
jgi:hypothetical protein